MMKDYQITAPQLEKLVDKVWVKSDMQYLEIGDTFRMWIYPKRHMKWVLHKDEYGNTEWVTISKPRILAPHGAPPEEEIWSVDVIKEEDKQGGGK